ncbi:MAG: ATP-binding cassette domain-containing protein [Spirochaetaceae bacterium]|jgi:molybdate transport system ATP-binding protein|nr:ATP-binding cassette domain-containing protein [Spirochaetaceae bacterium]
MTVCFRKKLSRAFTLELDFKTADGCLGILGPSGSGKSMTLKCIAGIETPDEGHIAVDGRTLYDSAGRINLRPQERRVGYLFQNYALFPNMTVMENILSPPRAGKGGRPEAAKWIERFGLGGMENRYPRQLSGGQQQRTALARMLISAPDAALFDEPFSALDSTLREYMEVQLQELLRGAGGAGGVFRNAILVTHNRDEAYRLCPQLAVMSGGGIIVRGGTDDVFRNPRFVEAARLTGCKNISPVRRLSENEVFALDWELPLRLAGSSEGVTHIGIRAHDFVPVSANAPPGLNEVRIAVSRLSSEPFEEAVLFTNADAARAAELKEIWWKYSKYLKQGLPERLFLPPEVLLPLRD